MHWFKKCMGINIDKRGDLGCFSCDKYNALHCIALQWLSDCCLLTNVVKYAWANKILQQERADQFEESCIVATTKKEFLPTISKPLIALAYKKIPTVWCLKAKLEGDLAEENELISLKKAAGRGWRNSVMERRIYGRSGQWWMMMVERIFHCCFCTWYDLFLTCSSRNQ